MRSRRNFLFGLFGATTVRAERDKVYELGKALGAVAYVAVGAGREDLGTALMQIGTVVLLPSDGDLIVTPTKNGSRDGSIIAVSVNRRERDKDA